jgi:hypothetical protein
MRSHSAPRHAPLIPLAIAIALSAGAALGAARVASAGDKDKVPSFQGTWKLDESKSESLRAKMDEMRKSGGMGGPPGGGMGGHGGYGGHGGMGGGMGGHHGGPPSGGGPEGQEGATGTTGETVRQQRARSPVMKALAEPPLLMSLDQTDDAIDFSDGSRRIELIEIGEPKEAPPATPAAPAEGDDVLRMTGKWKGDRLVAEASNERGKLSETYELSKDGSSLLVTVRMESSSGRPPIELKRVYQRYEGE